MLEGRHSNFSIPKLGQKMCNGLTAEAIASVMRMPLMDVMRKCLEAARKVWRGYARRRRRKDRRTPELVQSCSPRWPSLGARALWEAPRGSLRPLVTRVHSCGLPL